MLRFFPRTDNPRRAREGSRSDMVIELPVRMQRLGRPLVAPSYTPNASNRTPSVSTSEALGLALRLHTQPASVIAGRDDAAALHRSTTIVTKRILVILQTQVEPLSALIDRIASTEHLDDLRQAGLTGLDDNTIAALRQSALVRGCRLVEDARQIGIDGVLRVATTSALKDDGHWWGGPNWEDSVDAFFESGQQAACPHQTMLHDPEVADDASIQDLLTWWAPHSRTPGRLSA